MYKGFNLKLSETSAFANRLLAQYGSQAGAFRARKASARATISAYLQNGAIDATQLQEDWFSSVPAHIFISHSHADEKLAMAVAAALEDKLELDCFIDSCVWGNADDLLKEIDNEYCLQSSGKMYDYAKRNRSTSHVHMMLQGALVKMIDRSECVIFLNTPKSMVVKQDLTLKSRTSSPWIYSEILATRLIEKREPERTIRERVQASLEHRGMDEMPAFHHDLDLKHLTAMSSTQLDLWLGSGRRGESALDALYGWLTKKS